jgi:hypothetical protein
MSSPGLTRMNEIELAKKAPTTPQGDPFSRSGAPDVPF